MRKLFFSILISLTGFSHAVLAEQFLQGLDANSTWGDFKGKINKIPGFTAVKPLFIPIDAETFEQAWDRCEKEAKINGNITAQFPTDKEGDFRYLVLQKYKIPGREPRKLAVHSDDGVSVFIMKSSATPDGLPMPGDRPVLSRFNKGQNFRDRNQSFHVINYILKPQTDYTICVFYGNNYRMKNGDVDGLSLYLLPLAIPWFTLRVDSNMDKKLDVNDEADKQDITKPMILDVNNGDGNNNKTPDNEEPEAIGDQCVKNVSVPSGKGHEFPMLRFTFKPSLLPKGYKVILSKKDIVKNPPGVMRVFAKKTGAERTWEPIIDKADGMSDLTARVATLGDDNGRNYPPTLDMGLETYSWGVVEIKADAVDANKNPATPVTMFSDKLYVEGNVDRYFDGKTVHPLKSGSNQRPVRAGVYGQYKKPANIAGQVDAIRCHFTCTATPVTTRYKGTLRNNGIKGNDLEWSIWFGLQTPKIGSASPNPEGWIQGGLLVSRPLTGGQSVRTYVETGGQPANSSYSGGKMFDLQQTLDSDVILLRNRSERSGIMLIKTGGAWKILNITPPSPDGKQSSEPFIKAFMEADFNNVEAGCEMPMSTTNIPGSKDNPVVWNDIELGCLKDSKNKQPAEGTRFADKYAEWALTEGYEWFALDGVKPHIYVPNGKNNDPDNPPNGKGDNYHYHVEMKKELDDRFTVKAWDTRN